MSNKKVLHTNNKVENEKGIDSMKDLTKLVQEVMEEDNLNKSETMRWLHFVLQFDISETAKLVGVRYQFSYNVLSRTAAEKGKELKVSEARRAPLKPQIIELWEMGLERNEIHEELGASKPYIYKVTSEIEDLHGSKAPKEA